MGKKILIGITILLISGLFAGWYYFTREAKYFGTSAFSAVPESGSVIVRIPHFKNYTSKSLNNPIWKTYSTFPGINTLHQKICFADSLLNRDSKLSKFFTDNDLTIAFGKDNDHFWNLTLIELSGLNEKLALSDLTKKILIPQSVSIEKVKSGETTLSCYQWDEAGKRNSYYFTFYHGLFLASTDKAVVIQSINMLQNPMPPTGTIFEKANKTASGNIDLNIYLNHKNLSQFTRTFFAQSFWEKLHKSSALADWSEIDLTQKSTEFLFNGFSFTSDSLNNYFNIFLHQQALPFNVAELMPAETSCFLSLMISNPQQFFQDYENLLNSEHQPNEYKNSLAETDSLYGVDLQKIVIGHLDGTVSMVYTDSDPVMSDEHKFLILKTRSGSAIEQAMMPLVPKTSKKRKHDLSKNFSLYKIDNENIFKIYKTSVHDFGRRVFGSVFASVVTDYFTIYNNYLVMGASYEALGEYLKSAVLQQTLSNSKSFNDFNSGLSNRMNCYLWFAPDRSHSIFKEVLNPDIYKSIEDQKPAFNKIESAGWQIGVENGMIYNLAKLKYNADINENPISLNWSISTGNSLITKPKLAINPSDPKRHEIIFQDSNFNLYLTSIDGRILWKIKLSGPVRSQIFQLDCFKNGRLQYFFSTDKALHMIAHDGRYVQNYPVPLSSVATNGVTVVDYDHKKDYRFFIAGKDHKIHLYDKKGKIITDWAPDKTEHDIVQPVQHFRVDSKDYIVFTDKNHTHILDRKGKSRVNIKENINFSQNCFTLEPASGKSKARLITTNINGNIIAVGFDGSVKKITTGKFSPHHFFIYDHFNSETKCNYIILDGDSMVVYDQQLNLIIEKKINHKVDIYPELFTFADKSHKIGFTDTTKNRIYLYNADGNISKGFPLEGNSQFSLDFFGCQNGSFNVITGSANGNVSNYKIK
ncbi:MAG: hypothetical protein WCL21_11135 [Mariniphaga sp.]